jgi:hypothetical protein
VERERKEEERWRRRMKEAELAGSGDFSNDKFGSGIGKDLQLPDAVDLTGGESLDIGGAKRLSADDVKRGREREKIMSKYERAKERIAVSYVADVERERAAARDELQVMMDAAALKIQSWFRCGKAKSYIEDVLLRLQAAAVLQGIVRRNQSKSLLDNIREKRDAELERIEDLKRGVAEGDEGEDA